MNRLKLLLAIGLASCTCEECGQPPDSPFCKEAEDPIDTGTNIDTPEPTLGEIECGLGTCPIAQVTVSYAYINTCFITGGTFNSGDVPAPGYIIGHCTTGQPDTAVCTIPYEYECSVTPVEAEPDVCTPLDVCELAGAGSLATGNTFVDPTGYCAWDYTTAFSEIDTEFADIVSDLNAGTATHCSTVFSASNVIETLTTSAASTCDDCPQARIWYPGMDYGFDINASNSYLRLQKTGQTTLTSAMDGAIAFETTPDRTFFVGHADAANGSFAGFAFTNWQFYFDNEISFTGSSGDYTVTPGQVDAGNVGAWGEVDGLPYYAPVKTNNDITGTINNTNHTWTMEYTETPGLGVTITMHLEGTIY